MRRNSDDANTRTEMSEILKLLEPTESEFKMLASISSESGPRRKRLKKMPRSIRAKLRPGFSFNTLDLTADYQFKTSSSVGFTFFPNKAFSTYSTRVCGYLDVHYPCIDYMCRAMLRVVLPRKYAGVESLRVILSDTLGALEIPEDESYEMIYTEHESGVLMLKPEDYVIY